ncbi:OLC1v1022081C2 [Oldenlandia corymbosa var. corymbosa]|uniref:Exonuclease 1 n=1 Tax=Oldenlandia corymbosa var. corymbosa TaxID=529605 RepID=A0AAV1BXQ3_OLDCO|nr:OLC1v1022081C2 [Oldenlandia corymbosa var. corymbosa]
MGITGLLPLLKSIMLPVHIKDLKGCSVAVDTYSWLHKGALSCSKELCKGLPTSKHIQYCMHRVNMLRHYGIKPILVFDGGLLPMKSDQENKRARSRKENLSRAMEHESNGNMTAAYECYQKAVDISPSVAYDLIQVLKQENVSYIVAPYEADAQMTYLAVSKQVDAVITEDSDLIAFGCPRIIYKMDKFGQGVEFRASMLQQNKELILTGFTKQMILEMCILSGCDYLQSLPGMGLKKAHALIKKFKSHDRVLKHLKYSSVAVSPLYEESFKKAILTFQHQRVYDPVAEEIAHILEFCYHSLIMQTSIPQDIARAIAKGDLDPITKMPFEGEHDSAEIVDLESYEEKYCKAEGAKKKLDLPAQTNLLTNYFCSASIEAKRKYRAPRVSPKIQNTDNGIPNAETDFGGNMNSTAVVTESVLCLTALEASEVPQPQTGADEVEENEDRETHCDILQDPIYKPCAGLHKKKHTSDPSQSKLISMTVRRSYILPQPTNTLNGVQETDMVASDRDAVSDRCATRLASVYSDRKSSTVNKNVVVRSRYFQGKSTKGRIGKNENQLVDGIVAPRDKNLSSPDEIQNVSTKDEGNSMDRDHYFQEHSVVKLQNFTVEDGTATNIDKYAIPRISADNSCLEEARKRRKVASTDDEAEDSRENSTADYTSEFGNATCEMKEQEEKFGCNISHIGHYSEIAEKSLEKFVSVISSFKFTSNGSRASGLRAPLKDVKNTCSNRSSSNMDLSRFAYAPRTKGSSASRRKVKVIDPVLMTTELPSNDTIVCIALFPCSFTGDVIRKFHSQSTTGATSELDKWILLMCWNSEPVGICCTLK